MMRLGTLLIVASVLFAICCSAVQVDVQVGGTSSSYSPASAYAQPGDTVVWTWAGGLHSVNQAAGATCTGTASPLFTTLQAISVVGHTYNWTVPVDATTGTVYNYYCIIHCSLSNMKGTITIGTAPPTTTPSQTTTSSATTTPASTTTHSGTNPGTTTPAGTATTTPAGTSSTTPASTATTTPASTATTTPASSSTTTASASTSPSSTGPVYVVTVTLSTCPSAAEQDAMKLEWANTLGVPVSQISLLIAGCKRQTTATITINAAIEQSQMNAFVSALNSGSAGSTTKSLVVSDSATAVSTPTPSPSSAGSALLSSVIGCIAIVAAASLL